MECVWCGEQQVTEATKDCYWVMPDGRRTVQILSIPALHCESCGVYLSDTINQQVEEYLSMGDLASFSGAFTFAELKNAPRIKLFELK